MDKKSVRLQSLVIETPTLDLANLEIQHLILESRHAVSKVISKSTLENEAGTTEF